MSVSHHHHLSAQRIFKDSSLHFAFRANTFLMLLPLRPHPPSIQQPQLPISKGKTKAGKQGNEGISFGSAFWALTLTEADLSGFARLLLDSLSTAATSLWIFWNVVWKVAIDHLRIPLFFFSSLSGQRDEATRMIAWACYVNHAGNAVCPSVTLYWMWQRTSTGTRWHVVSRTQKKQNKRSIPSIDSSSLFTTTQTESVVNNHSLVCGACARIEDLFCSHVAVNESGLNTCMQARWWCTPHMYKNHFKYRFLRWDLQVCMQGALWKRGTSSFCLVL